MELEKVSLWVGTFESDEQLEKYIEIVYRECENDCDCDNCELEICVEDDIYSTFEKKFLDGYYCNEDFREKGFHDIAKKSIEVLLDRHSYCDQIIPKFMENIEGAEDIEGNTVILLYDCDYKGEKLLDKGEGYSIRYIGTVSYDSKLDE